jgi:hypothetical protein
MGAAAWQPLEENVMKFMVMHKHDKKTEAGFKPPMDFIQKMGGMVGGLAQSGKLLDGDGLGASSGRSRVTFHQGKATVAHGPFGGSNELPAGFVKIKVGSRDEAIEVAKRVGEAIGGDVEVEASKLTESWDLGFGEKPANAPERYLIIHKGTPATEAGKAPNLDAVTKALGEKGVLLGATNLTPSSKAKRLTWRGGKHNVVDGPFSESKELIGGYVVLDMNSVDECIAFTREYAALMLTVYDTLEIDIRPL